MSKIKQGNIPRSFDAGDLIVRDDKGNVKDLRESPCWKEIGYNPNMPKAEIIAEYEACESEKRNSLIAIVVAILLGLTIVGLMIRAHYRSTKPKTEP